MTAAGDRFVLTDLESGRRDERLTHQAPSPNPSIPTTEAYVLNGGRDDLRGLVGQRVRVSGEADPMQVVEFSEIVPQVRIAAERIGDGEGDGDKVTPTVAVDRYVRLETHELAVLAVDPTGERCEVLS